MTDHEDFLARWSRRKRRAAESGKAAPPAAEARDCAVPEQQETADHQPAPDTFDPATLPPIDSITALSDIRDFLRAGVPADLTRAALRRAWSADPAIRDFVGLAENAWDFTDPNAMPGFGPLQATDDVRQMLTQIMSRPVDMQVPTEAGARDPAQHPELNGDSGAVSVETAAEDAEDNATAEPPIGAAGVRASTEIAQATSDAENIAAQKQESDQAPQKTLLHRTHGGALPH